MFDCESEGLIRFRDGKQDRIGFFDSLGTVVIPAIYNYASPFRNGLSMVIAGAEKVCLDDDKFSQENPCEHWRWKDGKNLLIDRNNNILIDNFEPSAELDWYSLHIQRTLSETSLTETFEGVNGLFYSFINVEEQFKSWLFDYLLQDLNKEKLINNSYNRINYWDDSAGWIFEDGNIFIDKNFEVLKSGFLDLTGETADFFITTDDLNRFIYDSGEFEKYFDDCGNAKTWRYPVLDVVINNMIKNEFYQDHFEFLRTDDGYKLISVTLRTNKLKH